MRKCNGNNTREWGFDAIFDVQCSRCGYKMEFFKDDVTRYCSSCRHQIVNPRKDFGCGQWCNASSEHRRNLCSKYRKSKDRFVGRLTF